MTKLDLSVEFCGFKCENPFFLAASPVSRSGDMIERAFEAGFGGVITKSVSLDQDLPDHSLSPRFAGIRLGGNNLRLQKNIMGMGNIDFRIDRSVKEIMDSYAEAKRKYPNKMLIISIKGEHKENVWKKLTEYAVNAKADAIELCLSCPDGAGEGSIGQNPESIKEVIDWVKKYTDLPILVKLTPHVDSLKKIARTIKETGGVGVSAVNTYKCISGFNLTSLTPIPTIEERSTSPGISGGAIRPLAQYCVYEIAGANTGLQIAGVGGITSSQDSIEYLLLGATTVQIATQVMFEGYDFVKDLIEGLDNFMEEHNIKKVEDIIGSSLNKFTPATKQLSRKQQLFSNINQDICINCGRCYPACRDGGYQAITFSPERLAQVDQERCVGCGLCRIVCPAPGAIYFTNQDDKKERPGLN